MDHALDVARSLGIRVIIPFVDQWTWHGGIQQYSKFRGWEGDDCDLIKAFFTDMQIRDDFKRMIRLLLERENSINGIKYKDDPTILAWEVSDKATGIIYGGGVDRGSAHGYVMPVVIAKDW